MFIKTFLVTLLVFLAIDAVWLGLVAKGFYQNQFGSLMKSNVNWVAAFSVYVLFAIGLTVFVIEPALGNGTWLRALLMGVLFGLIVYATYDFTNLATLKDWPLTLTIVDLIWGATVAGSVSIITYFIVSKL